MKAVILAGGVGKRLRPLTIDKPKVMVSVKGDPLIAHVIRGLKPHVSEVVLVVGYKRELIMNYLGTEFEGVKINYVFQKEFLGTGHACLQAEQFINDSFIMVYGDLFFNPSIYDEVLSQDSSVIVAKTVPNPESYGVLEVRDNQLVRILEKVPNPPSNLINAGIYLLPIEVFNACRELKLSERGEYELTDAITSLISRGFKFKVVTINEWVDVGTLERLKIAEEMFF